MRKLTAAQYDLLAMIAAHPEFAQCDHDCEDMVDAAAGDRTIGDELIARGLIRGWACRTTRLRHGEVTALGRLALRLGRP
ncbi:MAG TPA: hypothetical protein VIV58_22325 [Kofleriaceae bacterium]